MGMYDVTKEIYRKLLPEVFRKHLRKWTNTKFNNLKAQLTYFLSRRSHFYAENPSIIRIEPSGACNLKCRHCPTGSSMLYDEPLREGRGIMDQNIFRIVLNQIASMKSVSTIVLYLGGESLLNRDLPEMVRAIISETSVKDIELVTNGMLLNKEISIKLIESGINRIQVSIDGRTPEENDQLRCGARYEVIRDNVLHLSKLAPGKISISNVIIADSIDELRLEPVLPDFLKLDFPGIAISSYFAMKWPGQKADWIEKGGFRTVNFGYTNQTKCVMPFKEISIRWNGDVVMCCYDIASGNVLGNVRDSSLLDIWNSKEYRNVRKSIAIDDLAGLPGICKLCPVFSKQMLVKK